MPTSESSHHLDQAIAAARAQQEWGFEALFVAYANPLRGFARLRGADDPEGLANATLFDAFRRLHTFEGDAAAFRAWIYRILRNKIIDDHRRRSRRPATRPLDDDGVGPQRNGLARADLAPAADEVALSQLGLEDLRAPLAALTPDQREVMVLRFVADLSIEQTAEVVDKPVTAVKALQRRATAALRRAL